MKPTRIRDLLLLALFAAGLGWSFIRLSDSLLGNFPPVPWLAPATLALLAVGLLAWTLGVRGRIQRKEGSKEISPLLAARTAALSLAASRTGALVCGGYLGAALAFSAHWDTIGGRNHTLLSLCAALAALAVVLAALWLESVCRLPPDQRGRGSDTDAGD
ncbi:MAG: DUF3180 domain-containing protein [Actinomycetes bacterium]